MKTRFGVKGFAVPVECQRGKKRETLRTDPASSGGCPSLAVWGCGSVWSHCSLVPCVSLTALVSSNPRLGWGSVGAAALSAGVKGQISEGCVWASAKLRVTNQLMRWPAGFGCISCEICTWLRYCTAWYWRRLIDHYRNKDTMGRCDTLWVS